MVLNIVQARKLQSKVLAIAGEPIQSWHQINIASDSGFLYKFIGAKKKTGRTSRSFL